MEKKKLLISFSGGETSGYMLVWCWLNWRNVYDIVVVFANTGDENEETLEFVQAVSEYWDIPVVWLEAVFPVKVNGAVVPMSPVVAGGKWAGNIGTTFQVVDFASASRRGEPFENMILKFGMPSTSRPFCSTHLKERPITAYQRSIGWDDAFTVIGIRADEADRMSVSAKERKLLYPLIYPHRMNKAQINAWWEQQPFRLQLKSYEGNCRGCWKKSRNALKAIARDTPERLNTMLSLENLYSHYFPSWRRPLTKRDLWEPHFPLYMYRGQSSLRSIIDEAQSYVGTPVDVSLVTSYELDFLNDLMLDGESCEVFSKCE